jgi:hypothetical protein
MMLTAQYAVTRPVLLEKHIVIVNRIAVRVIVQVMLTAFVIQFVMVIMAAVFMTLQQKLIVTVRALEALFVTTVRTA